MRKTSMFWDASSGGRAQNACPNRYPTSPASLAPMESASFYDDELLAQLLGVVREEPVAVAVLMIRMTSAKGMIAFDGGLVRGIARRAMPLDVGPDDEDALLLRCLDQRRAT